MRGLLYYDTIYGSTKQISDWIIRKVNCAESIKIVDGLIIDRYCDFIIIGTPIFIGKPMQSVINFIETNKDILLEKPVFAFINSWAQSTEYKNECSKFIDLLLSYLFPCVPAICRSLPGRLYMNKISENDRYILKRLLRRIDNMAPEFNSEDVKFTDKVNKKLCDRLGGDIVAWLEENKSNMF